MPRPLARTNNLFLKTVISLAMAMVALWALQAHALGVSPYRTDVALAAGERAEIEFRLRNRREVPVVVDHFFANFDSSNGDAVPDFIQEKTGLASWMDAQRGIVIEPGGVAVVPVSIDAPLSARPGGHFAGVFWSESPLEDSSDTIALSAQIATLVFVEIDGNFHQEGYLAGFAPIERGDWGTQPEAFEFVLKNEGDNRLMPRGNIVIRNTLGAKVASFDANPGRGNTLPQSERAYRVQWPEHEGRWAGRYTARILVEYGSEGHLMATEKATWWVMNFRLMWGLLPVVGLFGIMVLYKRIRAKSRKQRTKKRS